MTTQSNDRENGSWQERLLGLSRYTKRGILAATDFIIAGVVLWGALSLRYGKVFYPSDWDTTLLLLAGPLITVLTLAHFGVYRVVTRHLGYRNASKVFLFVLLSVLIWSFVVFMVGQFGIPRSTLMVYAVGAASLITLFRVAVGLVLENAGFQIFRQMRGGDRSPVLIYGAGRMGVQLMDALGRSRDRRVVGFIDFAPTLWGQYLKGIKVYRPERLEMLIETQGVREVILAMPEGQRRERRALISELERFPVQVKILPAFEDVASGRVRIADVRPVDVVDLLGRDAVPPSIDLLARNTRDKSVMVTGSGGSIGSELVRQILKHRPRQIVLLDISEPALYAIEREVERVTGDMDAPARPKVQVVLGSVLDKHLMMDTLARYGVQTIYHAAAYKHVPIVEANPIAGIENNALGAVVVAEAARVTGVERVVLISTDKAVRPTNVMGASKRLAELVLQAAASETSSTVFTMVRFGNVLDSSGSVVPVFRSQIKAGGPVTVTHPEIERYFMSIPEAAELVLQAGAMARGGEVFVLHMGDPVKIADLARLMINLSGLSVRDANRPDGDIEIVYTGLRPGEKFLVVLFLGGVPPTTGTEHPRIWKSDEPFLSPEELARELATLKALMTQRDMAGIDAFLARLVEGYAPQVEMRPKETLVAPWPPHSGTVH